MVLQKCYLRISKCFVERLRIITLTALKLLGLVFTRVVVMVVALHHWVLGDFHGRLGLSDP